MLVLIISMLAANFGEAATFNPREDYARRQKLQRSAEEWFRREILPTIVGRPNLRSVRSYGVVVKEKGSVLPPDLGGPLPGSPVEIQVEVSLSGTADDRHWGQRSVQCRISQRLLARNNGKGLPESVRPNQPLRAPLACVSGSFPRDDWRRHPGGYPWGY